MVGSKRWSYEGLLPFMRRTEKFFDTTTNPAAHGHDGPMKVEEATTPRPPNPMRQAVLQSWEAIGIKQIPHLDANAGQALGIGQNQANQDRGRRQVASMVYPLGGVEVLSDSVVSKILTVKSADAVISAQGVQLADGTEFRGREIILTAGSYRTPQILMLSGIGPAETLRRHGIPLVLDQPEVGRNFHDHLLSMTSWRLKDGVISESDQALFRDEEYDKSLYSDFYVTAALPKEGLTKAIEEDTGVATDASHPLLQDCAHSGHLVSFLGAGKGAISLLTLGLINEARGSVTIRSADINDAPVIDPNFLGCAVDRYTARETFRRNLTLLLSEQTVLGREWIDGDMAENPLTAEATDEEIDARVREVSM